LDENDNLFSEESYIALMIHQRNDVHQFQYMEGPLKGNFRVDKLSKYFELLSELKMVLQRLPPHPTINILG